MPDLLLLRTDATLSRVTGGRDSPGRLLNQILMASVRVSPNSAGERLWFSVSVSGFEPGDLGFGDRRANH